MVAELWWSHRGTTKNATRRALQELEPSHSRINPIMGSWAQSISIGKKVSFRLPDCTRPVILQRPGASSSVPLHLSQNSQVRDTTPRRGWNATASVTGVKLVIRPLVVKCSKWTATTCVVHCGLWARGAPPFVLPLVST